MRLKPSDRRTIVKVAKSVFGNNVTVLLFGSRTDDSKKGGDIDLCIRYNPNKSIAPTYQSKLKFLVEVKKQIGDQKIDIIFDSGNKERSIFKTIQKEGIPL